MAAVLEAPASFRPAAAVRRLPRAMALAAAVSALVLLCAPPGEPGLLRHEAQVATELPARPEHWGRHWGRHIR
eukprot:CAMPEP_0176256690 /NCGR_PEP_ID=MMETSP0121_2-20121125/37670_1 /TAXON_ID=160619 /ORGANISM="Kryptoperidinium foliaceum, Strain CCMP 1326" /LENGTH=72 /DNA_ID=CAMNT_0017596523 /DNA_START=93 /DNA_END=308 /DNA_ORIENTATION=+